MMGKFCAPLVPVVWITLWLVIADRLLHREWQRAALIFRLAVHPRSVRRPR